MNALLILMLCIAKQQICIIRLCGLINGLVSKDCGPIKDCGRLWDFDLI